MIATTEPDSPAYAEALYWRATLAATSADAERDFRRIVVEYPLSPRESDALFQLAQREAARGDRASAATHLERYLLENPATADAPRAELLLVRVSFEQNDLPHGCVALTRALREVPESSVELHNQLTYYSPRCVGVDTTRATQVVVAAPTPAPAPAPPPAAVPAATPHDSVRADTTHRDSTAHDNTPHGATVAPHHGKFTLQVAAYTTKKDADFLAKKLKTRGLDARVAGTTKLFRVRIGYYDTRAAAAAAAKELKAKKIDAFVTDVGPDDP